jgi:putative ABC transport system permease protein
MAIFEALRMALEALRGHKLRTSLTLVGMVIGVFAIIVSVTAVEVIDVYFKERLQFLGSSTFTISRTPPIQLGDTDRGMRNRPAITYDEVERLSRSMNLPVSIGLMEDFSRASVRYGERETTEPNKMLMGVDENMLDNYSYELDQGRFLTDQDIQYARPITVIGSEIAEELFLNETPLGKQIRFEGHRFEVVGVLKEKGNILGNSLEVKARWPG